MRAVAKSDTLALSMELMLLRPNTYPQSPAYETWRVQDYFMLLVTVLLVTLRCGAIVSQVFDLC